MRANEHLKSQVRLLANTLREHVEQWNYTKIAQMLDRLCASKDFGAFEVPCLFANNKFQLNNKAKRPLNVCQQVVYLGDPFLTQLFINKLGTDRFAHYCRDMATLQSKADQIQTIQLEAIGNYSEHLDLETLGGWWNNAPYWVFGIATLIGQQKPKHYFSLEDLLTVHDVFEKQNTRTTPPQPDMHIHINRTHCTIKTVRYLSMLIEHQKTTINDLLQSRQAHKI